MSPLAAFRRPPKPETEETSTLGALVAKRDGLRDRAGLLRERAVALNAEESRARAALEAAAAAGEETAGAAEELARLTARRGPLVLEVNAAASALASAEALVQAEETRLRTLELDAEETRLRTAEEEAEERLYEALVAAGKALEAVVAAEHALQSFLNHTGRPGSRGFLDGGAKAFRRAREAAVERARRAVEEGADERSASAEAGALVYANIRPRRRQVGA